MWSTLGKILLVLVTLVIAFFLLAKFSGKSFGLVDNLASIFGVG